MALPAKIASVAEQVLNQYECDLVLGTFRRERVGMVLRLLIERRGMESEKVSGVDHQLCAAISRDLGAELEVEEAIGKQYFLEVSSPGIERPLVTEADYSRFTGRLIAVKTRKAVEKKKKFKGVLNGLKDGDIQLTIGHGEIAVPLSIVEKAHLVYEP